MLELFLNIEADTDEMYQKIEEFEADTNEAIITSEQAECEIRDLAKRVQKLDTRMEDTMEALQVSASKMEIAESEFKDKEDEVNGQTRRTLLLEEESRISVEKLANTVMKLAFMSKDADTIVKGCRHWESMTMNNEVEIEQLDKNTREARRIGRLFIFNIV